MKKNLIPLFALIFSLTGCVGMGTFENRSPGTYVSGSGDRYEVVNGHRLKDEEEFIRTWGQPISRRAGSFGDEELIYRGGLAWRGAVLWMIVPIPLVAPTGHNEVVAMFHPDGELVGVFENSAEYNYYGCFFVYCGHLWPGHG